LILVGTWRLSDTLDASFYVEALNEAIAKYGQPEIMPLDSVGTHGSNDVLGRHSFEDPVLLSTMYATYTFQSLPAS
jgi:hypothetical protein